MFFLREQVYKVFFKKATLRKNICKGAILKMNFVR